MTKSQGVPMPMPVHDQPVKEEFKQPQPKKERDNNYNKPKPMPQPVMPSPAQQLINENQERMMQSSLMTSLTSLLAGPAQNQVRSKQPQNAKQHQKKDRLPSLHIGNLPEKFYDLDLFKFIKSSGHNVHKAIVVLDKETQKNCLYGYA